MSLICPAPLEVYGKTHANSSNCEIIQHRRYEQILQVKKGANRNRKALARIDSTDTIPRERGLGLGRCTQAASGRVTLVTSGCESWGALPAPCE